MPAAGAGIPSNSGGESENDKLSEGIAIVAISSVLFDMWTAGYLVGDWLKMPARLDRFITMFLISAVLFGIWWAYNGWASTHDLQGNPFVDTYNYFTQNRTKE